MWNTGSQARRVEEGRAKCTSLAHETVDPRTTTRTSEQQHQLQQRPKRLVRFCVVVHNVYSELREKARTRRSQATDCTSGRTP